MQLCHVLVLAAAALGVRGDDCAPPKPGEKLPTAAQCCKKEKKIPEVMKDNIPKCTAKFPLPAKSDPQEVRSVLACTSECVFEESNLLTPEGKLDLPAIAKMITDTYPEKKNVSGSVDKCSKMIVSRMDPTAECKSGAFEMEECLRRECFLHCPKELWTASKECEDLRKKVEMCPTWSLASQDMPKPKP
jgi:hypothetical protein